MSTETSAVSEEVPDPYKLSAADVLEPPRTFRGRLKYLGPGMIISASVVGAGELILTTALGAKAGFALLWLVIVSTAVKVWLQLELAQWTILTGKTALEGYGQVGRSWRGIGWTNALWIVADVPKLMQRGAIVGGVAGALSLMYPAIGAPLGSSSLAFWTVFLTLALIGLLVSNKYGLIERAATLVVVLFTGATVTLAIGLPLTPFAYGVSDIASGLVFAIPAGALGYAVAMFGITGIGADEMTSYGYWCIEKGYARWTGPDDGTEERARRAQGWITVMRTDVLVSWVICTACTLSFFVIGAAVLHPQGLVPSGNDVIVTLSRIYTDTMGEWARWLFLVGALLTLGSTLLAVGAGVPRLWANTLGMLGVIDWKNRTQRDRTIRILTVIIPSLWAVSFLVVKSPVLMLQIGGIASGIMLLAIVIAVWKLRTTEVDRRFKQNSFFPVALGISSAAIAALGVYSTLNVLGIGA